MIGATKSCKALRNQQQSSQKYKRETINMCSSMSAVPLLASQCQMSKIKRYEMHHSSYFVKIQSMVPCCKSTCSQLYCNLQHKLKSAIWRITIRHTNFAWQYKCKIMFHVDDLLLSAMLATSDFGVTTCPTNPRQHST